ncbi:MAG: hypothetical protein KA524_11620 [Nitrosomonas sp.]|nr:hypothetical protein [Nitrosomonas sp.]MBP6077065.1 hypothetical protein [Nitrosomonas sp.]
MAAFPGITLFITIFFLTGTSAIAEVPVSYSAQDSVANEKTAARHRASWPGMQWKLLPGEDIPQIARLMFPKDSVTRDKFIRAVIHTNPEHFPAKTYQPLPTGTVVHIPDLRTIGAYAAPSTKARKSDGANHPTRRESPAAPETVISGLSNDPLLLQLITQLEQIGEKEAGKLNTLTKHIALLSSQVTDIQSVLSSRTLTPHERPADSTKPSPEENLQPTKDAVPLSAENAQPIEDITAIPIDNTQHLAVDPLSPDEVNSAPMETALSFDTLFLTGILLTLVIVIMILRSYRKIKERLARPTDASLLSRTVERHRFEAILLHRDDKIVNSPEDTPDPIDPLLSETHPLIEQDEPEVEIQRLQKQLAINQHDISGWLLLFELLYKAGNKRDFKKNARRFKRLRKFPDIWVQIQDLGHRLEPNESLYFNEKKRQEKFFPDSTGTHQY